MKKNTKIIIVVVLIGIMGICGILSRGNLLSFCDSEIRTLYTHNNMPTAIRHYVCDENGSKEYETRDKNLIRAVMDAVKKIKITDQIDGWDYPVDILYFIMEDGRKYDIVFNDRRLYIYTGEAYLLYNIEREDRLWELFEMIDQDENLIN